MAANRMWKIMTLGYYFPPILSNSEDKRKDNTVAGLEKVPSGCPGQVDFPAGQVTFHSHLPNGQGPRQVICELNRKKSNLRATCPKCKLEFKVFSSPE